MKPSNLLILSLCFAGMLFGGLFCAPWVAEKIAYSIERGRARAARENLGPSGDLGLAFRQASKAVRPSVVSILAKKPPEDPAFERSGIGSGVIVSQDGYILTNYHVVEKAQQLEVQLSTGRRYEVDLIGTDEATDLAVLKLKNPKIRLEPARLGATGDLEVGDLVLAVGSPFGLSQSVTGGIVSAKGRTMGLTDYEDFIQTDAAINPGNSGGPLINLKGEVIGINTLIWSRTGANVGVGFAIPIELAQRVMEALINNGKVRRGWLGVMIRDLHETPELAKREDLNGGVYITDVSKGGPADQAGVQAGDILVDAAGTAIKDVNQLRHLIASKEPGTQVEVKILRDGKPLTVSVDLGELRLAAHRTRVNPFGLGESNWFTILGLELVEVPGPMAEAFGVRGPALMISDLSAKGAAKKSGLQVHDLLIAIEQKPVQTLRDCVQLNDQQALQGGLEVTILRQGQTLELSLKP